MSVIFKKELRSYFRRGSAFLFLAVSLFFISTLSLLYNFFLKFTQVESLYPFLTITMAVIFPIFAVNLFAHDKKSGTEKLLFALPIKPSSIVLGKYFASLFITAIPALFLALIPVVLGKAGKVNYISAYLSIACFFLFCAMMLAMCTYIASAMKKTLPTLFLAELAVIFSFLLYLVPSGTEENIWYTVAGAFHFLSPFYHLDLFFQNKLSLASVLYFLIFTVLFLFLSIIEVSRAKEKMRFGKNSKELRRFSISPILAVILSVCVTAVSVASYFVPKQYSELDLKKINTSSELIDEDYFGDISSTTKEFISSIETDVRIYIINPDGSDDLLENFIKLYDENSDAITVTSTRAENITDKLEALGWDGVSEIAPYTIVVETDKGESRTQVISPSYIYYYSHPDFGQMDYSTYSYYYSMLSQYASIDASYAEMLDSFIEGTKICTNIEQNLNEFIEYGVIDIIPVPYYLTGHGESTDEASVLNDAFLSFGFYFEKLDLSSVTEIPDDLSVIIINTPTSDLSDKETAMLSEFLANGGAMTLMTNEANLDMPNLMSLVTAYGVSAERGFVSFNYEATETEATEGEAATEEELVDNHIVEAYFNSTHEGFEVLAQYTTGAYYANHINISSELDENVIVNPVLTTDAGCYIDGVENSEGTKTVAVAIETKDSENPTRIVWFTGGDAFDGENLFEMNAYGAIYAIIWGVDDYASTLIPVAEKDIPIPDDGDSNYYVEYTEENLSWFIAFYIALYVVAIALLITALVMFIIFKRKKVVINENETVTETTEEAQDHNDLEINEETNEAEEFEEPAEDNKDEQ